MRNTFPLLLKTDFPAVYRDRTDTLQANLGYRCNQSCTHCHVAASPQRTEVMGWETMELLLRYLAARGIATLDLTGGAPELNPHFRKLVARAREQGVRVIDRCNLTILNEPGQEDLAAFLADQAVEITASLPCYLEENVDQQRGKGVFAASLAGLRKLNARGYGQPASGLILNLVYNPLGPVLPPDQTDLEAAYQRELAIRYGITFNHLLALANMPIQRFGSQLLSKGQFQPYMDLLKAAHRDENLIVVDGGSDDRTMALAEPLADRVIGSSRGRAAQMNAGAGQASGDILGSCTPTACHPRMRKPGGRRIPAKGSGRADHQRGSGGGGGTGGATTIGPR